MSEDTTQDGPKDRRATPGCTEKADDAGHMLVPCNKCGNDVAPVSNASAASSLNSATDDEGETVGHESDDQTSNSKMTILRGKYL